MTSAGSEFAVVVGIAPDGRVSDGTIAFVVDIAASLQAGVRLVHVVPTAVGGPSGTREVGIAFEQLLADGLAGLDSALARFRDRADGSVPVEAELVRGGVVATLVEHSRNAQLVVLDRHHPARRTRITSGSVTAGVAARAHAPVVAVRTGWQPRPRPLPVTVAVEDATRAASEIWTALGLGAATGLPVRLLRVAYLPQAYQELLRREVDVDDLLRFAREELRADAQLPDIVVERLPCTFEVRWGKPAEVLVEASAASSLLVMARRDPLMPFGSHLGPVVRQVLREADCPAMVVEPTLREVVIAGVPAPPAVTAAG
jgi:nucleotide-binding universal stress UspA family protein